MVNKKRKRSVKNKVHFEKTREDEIKNNDLINRFHTAKCCFFTEI